MADRQILRIMADGEYHSGEELGQLLGISRAAVWKQVKKLEQYALPLESVKGRGYRIEGGLDLLDQESLLAQIDNQWLSAFGNPEVCDSIPSTNTRVLDALTREGRVAYICTAETQTAGKGRRGRAWVSPYAGSIYLSMGWTFGSGAAALEGLSLAVGVAVAETLEAFGVEQLGLKWPNDLYIDGRKLGGILIEMSGDLQGPCQLVVGLGLNVNLRQAEGRSIDQPWIDLARAHGESLNRTELVAALINKIAEVVVSYEQLGFAHYREKFLQYDCFLDLPAYIKLGQSVEIGVARGVDDSGALLLETDEGIRAFNGGEVSLRRGAHT